LPVLIENFEEQDTLLRRGIVEQAFI